MLLLMACGFTALAGSFCSSGSKGVLAKTTVATPEENDYDVRYMKLDIEATNISTAIVGHVTTVATVVVPAMSEYYFELSNQLTIDSAKLNGQLLPVTTIGNFIRKITLPAPLPLNSSFTAEVFYHGAPAGGTGFFTIGILNGVNFPTQDTVTHTVSAAFHSRDWFPCKQSLRDKIDSTDLWITVPAGLKVASNGLLKNITTLAGGDQRFEWSTRYPTDFFLLSFAVARYDEYNYYVHFGPNDSMLVQNYIYDHPSVLQDHQDELDSIGMIIQYFSEIFGRYPFHEEKFGICQAPLSGGMENQTMVTLGSLEPTLIAHELAHQWWGDNVTCGTWRDVWLNEGWATYAEQLFIEHFHSPEQAQAVRTAVFNQVLNVLGGRLYVSDTTNEFIIYNNTLTYNKGAAVAAMLRFVINNDSLFFTALRNYHQIYALGTATTEDLKNIAEQVTQLDLDTFFHQWVYQEGYPRYSAKWTQNGNQVIVQLSHTSSRPLSVPVFKMPIEIKLSSPQGDTIVRVYNDQATQLFSFSWSKPMDTMFIDPNDFIVNRTMSITKDPTLSVRSSYMGELSIYPNPSSTGWQVTNVPAASQLVLRDIAGRELWQGLAVGDTITVPSAHLPAGTYILTVTKKNGGSMNYHLLR